MEMVDKKRKAELENIKLKVKLSTVESKLKSQQILSDALQTQVTELKQEIDSQLSVVHERLDSVRALIRANARSEQNVDGLLTKGESRYLDCLELQRARFEDLFR